MLIGRIGVGVVVLSGVFSLAGLPAPAGVVHGAPEPTATTPSASGEAQSGTPQVRPPAAIAPEPLTPRRAGRQTTSCEHGPSWVRPAAVVYHGPRDQKVVALTFDDGWGGRTLRKIFRILREKHVNATFFPVGQAIRQDPEAWRRIAAAGFPLADHTFDHGTLKGQCYSEQHFELTRAQRTYANVLGITSLPVMRPPGGLFDDATLAAATSVGEPTIVLWDVDSSDWTGIGPRRIRANALAGMKGSIVVLHTSSMSTVRALPGIIRGYRKRGFEFVTIGQLLGIPGSVPFPAGEPED
jgi:peptidoglycan/xylan/chitin deacetylase (PgdA/CDA1 family)